MILIVLIDTTPIRIVDTKDYSWDVNSDGDLLVHYNQKLVVFVPNGKWKYVTDFPADLPTTSDVKVTYPGGITAFNPDGTTTHTNVMSTATYIIPPDQTA